MAQSDRGARQIRGRGVQPGLTQQLEHPSSTVHPSVLKQARRTGVLNLSQKGLTTVPDNVWTVQEDVPDEAKSVSMDNSDEKWWDTVDLSKLILASNRLSTIGEGLGKLIALTVLDVHDNQLTVLPKAIGSLENLQKLDISHNQLSDIPACVGFLANLQTLSADHNQLATISEEICSLRQLEVLNLSNNVIESLPRYICLLSQLRNLNVASNKLTHLPPDLGSLSNLRVFEATHNQLLSIPEEFGNLTKLEQLYLRHNQLEYLPILRHCTSLKEILVGNNNIRGLTAEHLQHLGSLTCLDIRDNKLQKLPDEILLLEKLERLDLTNNDISTLPFVMGTMKNLKAVVLDGNPMRSIRRDIVMRGTNELKKYLASRLSDEEVKESTEQASYSNPSVPGAMDQPIRSHDLHQMKSLDYSNKKVSSLPDSVVEAALEAGVRTVNISKNLFAEIPSNLSVLAPKMMDLYLGHNRISQLSESISLFNKLQLLDLRSNQLSQLPPELSELSGLRELNISGNRFTQLPSVIYNLSSLEILFAHDNHLTEIDVQGFLKLTKLGTLDLQNNDISQVPAELGNCHWLKSLVLIGNPLRNPRAAVLAKGTPAILEYLRSRIVT